MNLTLEQPLLTLPYQNFICTVKLKTFKYVRNVLNVRQTLSDELVHLRTWMVVLVSGSRFFSFITLGFLPTVNGQPHRGISPPRPALWSRHQLGKKKTSFVTLCFIFNPSVAFAASSPRLRLMLVFLSPSILFINTCSSIHPSVGLSIRVAFCPTCLLSQLQLLQVFNKASCKDFFK